MDDKYALREVRVEIAPGVYLVADVTSMDGLAALLRDLKGKGHTLPTVSKFAKGDGGTGRNGQPQHSTDTPSGRIEVNAGIGPGSLLKHNVLAFKDDVPQLLRPSMFGAASDAALVLIHALETGLKSQDIEYESFKALYDSQNLKSGTPLAMQMSNLRKMGYLDKAAYKAGRKLRLTPKGDKRAIEVLVKLTRPGD